MAVWCGREARRGIAAFWCHRRRAGVLRERVGGSDRCWCRPGGRQRADAQQLAEVVGEAGQQVFASGVSEPAQAEGGEAARLLELAEDRLDDDLAASVASTSVRLT